MQRAEECSPVSIRKFDYIPRPQIQVALTAGRRYLGLANHLAIFPGAAIMLAVMGLNFLGDGLIDALDPKYRKEV